LTQLKLTQVGEIVITTIEENEEKICMKSMKNVFCGSFTWT